MPRSDHEHVGDLLVELLVQHGVETIFGLPGGQTAALYDAVDKRPGLIEHVIVRDERTTAYAADAYARLTGRVGVCDATVGPGAAKLPSGLGEALNSSIPVLALVSDLPLATEARRYRGATSQAFDQETLLRSVTKWQATVRRPQDLAPLVRRAFREATTGRPGPVALVLPQDVLDAPAGDDDGRPDAHAGTFGRFPALRPLPDPGQIAGVVAVLRRARRPLLLLGGGALLSGAGVRASGSEPAGGDLRVRASGSERAGGDFGDVVGRVAEAFGAAVATTLSGKGCIDERHPLAVGVLGAMGTSAARAAAEQADALLLVGTKAGSVATLSWSLPRPDQAVAQIDIDPAELGRDFPLDALALADARLALETIAAMAPDTGSSSGSGWPATVRGLTEEWRRARAVEAAADDVPIRPQRIIAELHRQVGPDEILVSDASLASGWLGVHFEQTVPGRRLLFPRGLAGLGWALPAAIGAAAAAPDHRVVALVGDGALAYAVGELAVVVERRLPITVVVLNNRSYGWIRWYRRIGFGRGWEHDDFGPTDFAAVAAGFGLATSRVDAPADLARALASALSAPGPSLVDVVSSVWDTPLAGHREALAADTPGAYGT